MFDNERHTNWQATLTSALTANSPPSNPILRTPDDVWIDEDSAGLPTATFDNIYVIVSEPSAERFGCALFDLSMGNAIIGRFIHWKGERAQPFGEAQAARLLCHLESIVTFQFGYDGEDTVDLERNYNQVLQWLRRWGKPIGHRMDVPQLNLLIQPAGGRA